MLISFCLHDEKRTERKVKILDVVKLLVVVVVVVVVECKSLKSNAKFNLIDTRRRAHTMLVQFILCKISDVPKKNSYYAREGKRKIFN